MVAHKPVAVEPVNIALGFGPRAARHRGPALVVNVEHQLVGLLFAVAEQLPEDVGHIGHQVDRVIPNDDNPRAIFVDNGVELWLLDLNRSGHSTILSNPAAEVFLLRTIAESAPSNSGRWNNDKWPSVAPTQTSIAPRIWPSTRIAGTPAWYCQ